MRVNSRAGEQGGSLEACMKIDVTKAGTFATRLLGAYLAVYEIQFSPAPVEVPTLILAAGLLGLPEVFKA